MAENKVQYNLKNVHYCPITTESPLTYASAVAVPGAVSLSLAQVGELKKFYADGIPYWVGTSNNGYEGDLEIARIPDQMLQDIWGMALEETDNVIVENVNDEQKSFALMFQIDGDENDNLYCFYNCTASRPGIDAATNEESKEPKPQKLSLTIAPLADGRIKASTSATATESVRSAWFTAPYEHA